MSSVVGRITSALRAADALVREVATAVRNRFPAAAISAIMIVAAVEIVAWQFGQKSPTFGRLETELSTLLRRPISVPIKDSSAFDRRHYDIHNPFFNKPGQQTFMPFVAMSGTGGDFPTDYFGFRNRLGDKIYFSPHKRPVIVMTGNSELAGIRHPKDIASLLEEELRRHGMEFDVLNLAAASYSLAAEIGAYVHFGDKACPSLVIAHSGGIEFQYGMVVPAKFRWLGLAYHPPQEEWAYRMYYLSEYTGPSIWRRRDPDARLDETITATERLLKQYRSLVERDGKTKFLFGAQKIGPTHPLFAFLTKETRDEFMRKLHATIDRIGINYIWFDDDPEVTLTDTIHSDAKSAEHIAHVYAHWIVKHRSLLRSEPAPECWWSG
jgi:hypothetical protein